MGHTQKFNPEQVKQNNRKGDGSEKNESFTGETSPVEMRRSFSQHFLGNTTHSSQNTKDKEISGNYDTDFPPLPGLSK